MNQIGSMMKISILFAFVSVTVCTSCAERFPRYEFEPIGIYSVFTDGELLYRMAPPRGRWVYWENHRLDGMFMMEGVSPFKGVSYKSRLAFEDYITIRPKNRFIHTHLINRKTYQEQLDYLMRNRFTPENRKEMGIEDVAVGETRIAGLRCYQWRTIQNYGPSPDPERFPSLLRILNTSALCPSVHKGHVWVLYRSYDIYVNNQRFSEAYGATPPVEADLIKDVEARLARSLDSLEFANPVSQDYDDLDEASRAWYEQKAASGEFGDYLNHQQPHSSSE
jgi:hypothetical protein